MSVNYSAKLILGYRVPSYLIGTVITEEKIQDLEEEGYWHYTNAYSPEESDAIMGIILDSCDDGTSVVINNPKDAPQDYYWEADKLKEHYCTLIRVPFANLADPSLLLCSCIS